MEINTTVPTLYKAAMSIYENIIEHEVKTFCVKIKVNEHEDNLRLLRVFAELAAKISRDFNVDIDVEIA
jgi:hypothetical protein